MRTLLVSNHPLWTCWCLKGNLTLQLVNAVRQHTLYLLVVAGKTLKALHCMTLLGIAHSTCVVQICVTLQKIIIKIYYTYSSAYMRKWENAEDSVQSLIDVKPLHITLT